MLKLKAISVHNKLSNGYSVLKEIGNNNVLIHPCPAITMHRSETAIFLTISMPAIEIKGKSIEY